MSFFNSANSGGSGLFGAGSSGNAANQAAGTNKPAVNIFGAANSSLPSSGIFGNTGTSSSTTPGSSLFGSTPNNPTTTATGGGELFGNAAAKPAGSNLFGAGTNTTSSIAPATSGLFGAATAKGSNIFGSNTSTTSTPATGGSIFGNTPSASSTATTSTATNPLFGGSSAFSLPKPADSGAKPAAASNFFAQPPSGTGATPSGTQGLFGLPAKPADTATSSTPGGASTSTATTSTAASGGTALFGGGGLFPKPPATTSSSTAVNTATSGQTSTTLGAGLFGTKPDEGKKGTAAAAPFSLFGGAKPDATATKDGEKKDMPAGTTTGAVVAVAPPSMLRGKTLEEIINKWTSDLEANVREFNKFGAEVAAWDRALIENGNNIAALYSYVLAAEKQQNEINEALNHIEQQQNDLATTLDAYEKVSQEILGGQSSTLRTLDTGPADNERDKNYMLATDLHTHLDDLSGSLTQMIESVNTLSITARSDDSSKDPMAQITQILSSHLESLQWIDGAVREIETKASDVEKRIKESGHALPGNGSKSRAFGLNR